MNLLIFFVLDSRGNNALHLAVKEGHIGVARVLVNYKTFFIIVRLNTSAEAKQSVILIVSNLSFNDFKLSRFWTLFLIEMFLRFNPFLLQLTESQIDAEATNSKGRNPLHILANFGLENSVSIFDLFIECMPNYPINRPDAEGNTRKRFWFEQNSDFFPVFRTHFNWYLCFSQ